MTVVDFFPSVSFIITELRFLLKCLCVSFVVLTNWWHGKELHQHLTQNAAPKDYYFTFSNDLRFYEFDQYILEKDRKINSKAFFPIC